MHTGDRILFQQDDFCIAKEYQALRAGFPEDGAIVTFSGLVRELSKGVSLNGLYLEHYPAMTTKVLADIVATARQKWTLGGITLIHRVGELKPTEQIVFVGVTSQHRDNAYLANTFIMDFLKTQAPFWKKELSDGGDQWVEAKQSDAQRCVNWRAR